MRLLVVHQNFPGQFGHLVRAWSARPGWEVRALARDTAPGLPGFQQLTRYRLARQVRNDQHRYLRQMEAATLHGQAAARAMLELRRQGFVPDVILAHPGWGETLYAKDVYPNAKLLHLCEWYYQAEGADLDFDPEFPLSFDDRARIRTWNALHSLNLANCDAGITPTRWQLSRHPALFQTKIRVQHEGIPCDALAPDASARVTLPDGTVVKAGDPVVTYVARNLEPYRGFHTFMRAWALIQRQHPKAQAVIVGGDEVSYGCKPSDAPHWRAKMLREVQVDARRMHFLGRVPYASYVRVLQVSAAHLYLSYPFVLSWSLLEAMACGAAVVGVDTPPVREVIEPGRHGFLVKPFSVDAIAGQSLALLEEPRIAVKRRVEAREAVQRLSTNQGLAGYDRILTAVLEGRVGLSACSTPPTLLEHIDSHVA